MVIAKRGEWQASNIARYVHTTGRKGLFVSRRKQGGALTRVPAGFVPRGADGIAAAQVVEEFIEHIGSIPHGT